MLIAIDESGSFVHSLSPGAWCVVAAYVFPERRKSTTRQALSQLKRRYGRGQFQEIKLKDIDEKDYFEFLSALRSASGCMFAVATDCHFADPTEIVFHRSMQAGAIRNYAPRMKYIEGRTALEDLADKVDSLAPQLYVQLVCQIVLITNILRRAVLYFAQRDPVTLGRFVWRIDQKSTPKSTFEQAFRAVTPGLIQTESFDEPMIFLVGADYSHFRRFEFSEEQYPEYLFSELGHTPESTVNIGKLLRENMQFPDSEADWTVQIADLLASGVRRSLRGQFSNANRAAALLGALTIQNTKPLHSVQLVNLARGSAPMADAVAARAANIMNASARPMLGSA